VPNIFRNAEGIIFDALCVGFRENHLSAIQIDSQSRYQTLIWRVLHACRHVPGIPFGNPIFLFYQPRFHHAKVLRSLPRKCGDFDRILKDNISAACRAL
jgi:ethanolamine ammonia-lyase large subunit